jgi:inner membrane transporter RhtA
MRMASVKKANVTDRVPPIAFFFVSAVFHYLGPAFAVLLFTHVAVLGVAWLRIASAAVVFVVWRRPWRIFLSSEWAIRRILIALGVVLGLMNACFYLAIAHIPLGTVSAIEFIGPIVLASFGARTPRNLGAVVFAAAGGWILTDARLSGEPLGFLFAFANCILFMRYSGRIPIAFRHGRNAALLRLQWHASVAFFAHL